MSNFSDLYPDTKDCFELEKQILIINNDIEHFNSKLQDREANKLKPVLNFKKEQFNLSKCAPIIEAKRMKDTGNVLDKYSELAKERIEKDSFLTRNNLILISVITFGALFFIFSNKNKKK